MLYIPECPAHKVGINIPPGESSDVPLINAKTVCAYAVDDLCGGSIYDGSVPGSRNCICLRIVPGISFGRPSRRRFASNRKVELSQKRLRKDIALRDLY